MKVTLTSTDTFLLVARDGHSMPCRLWTGETDDGVPVHAYVAVVSPRTLEPERTAPFDAELTYRPDVEITDEPGRSIIDGRSAW